MPSRLAPPARVPSIIVPDNSLQQQDSIPVEPRAAILDSTIVGAANSHINTADHHSGILMADNANLHVTTPELLAAVGTANETADRHSGMLMADNANTHVPLPTPKPTAAVGTENSQIETAGHESDIHTANSTSFNLPAPPPEPTTAVGTAIGHINIVDHQPDIHMDVNTSFGISVPTSEPSTTAVSPDASTSQVLYLPPPYRPAIVDDYHHPASPPQSNSTCASHTPSTPTSMINSTPHVSLLPQRQPPITSTSIPSGEVKAASTAKLLKSKALQKSNNTNSAR